MPVLAVIALIAAVQFARASAGLSEKILEDKPGLLVMELRISGHALRPAGGHPGVRVVCPGCQAPIRPDGPDLPVYRFDVLTGPTPPTVSYRILESETRPVSEGIAPVPREPFPNALEYHFDAARYREAAAAEARIFEPRGLGRASVRGVEVPLALWSENGKSLTLIKALRIELAFSGAYAAPAAFRQMERLRREVKNPAGGAYLFRSSAGGSPAGSALSAGRARGGWGLAKASAARDSLGSRFVRIRVGDNAVEGFDEDRVYGLSFSDLTRISGLGNALDAIKIRNLRIFTGINDTLPRRMDSGTVSSGTLREIPIEVRDSNRNGTFDGGDSILFFGHGTSLWKRSPESGSRIRYEFSTDPYSFDNFYFLDFGSRDGLEGGMRLPESGPAAPAMPAAAESYAYLRAEKEMATAACGIAKPYHKEDETGFEWHWFWKGDCDRPDTTVTLTASNLQSAETSTLPDLVQDGAGDSLFLGFYTFRSAEKGAFTPFYGGQGESMDPYPDSVSPGAWFVWTKPVPAPAALQLDKLIWGGSERRFEGYSVCYRRKHVLSGERTWIFPSETGTRAAYRIQNAQGAKCLRVEDGVATRAILLDGQGAFEDSLPPGSDARYLVYRTASALPAASLFADGLPAEKGALRDLGTGDGKRPEYLIITSRDLLPQALSLRDYRNDSKRALRMKTEVATVEDIYRQFSSGRMSPMAIRDFLRHAYHGWGDPAQYGKLTHVLLFGDGHYDYREIRARAMKQAPANVIPPFEFIFDGGTQQVASDDFYAMLESGSFSSGSPMLDVALGRVPVQTPREAADYLEKVAGFENPALAGEWRSRVVMAADDNIQRGSAGNLDPIPQGHTTDSDDLGDVISENEKGTTVDKVYLLDYPLNSAFHKPEAAQDLLAFINRGALLVNYIGHGASNQWSDEVLMQTNDAISRMRNEGRTPMINSFSCTVGRFESLTSEGMSEQFVKQRSIGAIAAVSATRESYPGANVALAKAYYKRLFPPDSSGIVITAGEALREAKNSSETNSDWVNDLKYNLLGEPVLLLRKPQLGITLTRVMDTIKALDCSEIKGRITGGSGSGQVNIKIVAGSVHKRYVLEKDQYPQEVEKRGNILFERTFPYKDGAFSADYFIPKQIAFGDTNAQVLVFAWDKTVEMEGTTSRADLHIQGTAQGGCATDSDGKGPRIRITGCQKQETGDLDFPDQVKLPLPYCLQILVEDSVGGVLSAQGPDEGTSVEVPGVLDPFHPLPGLDELYRKSYQFSLEKGAFHPGSHLLKVSARDGYGNMSQRQMRMELSVDSSLQTVMARNVPNPMKRSGTTFYFSAVRPKRDIEFGDPTAGKDTLEYELRIFNQAGNLVRVFPRAESGRTAWDGRDHWGSLLGNGVYFYSVIARQALVEAGSKPDYRVVSSKRNTLILSR
jgi:peptidase C25-like protein